MHVNQAPFSSSINAVDLHLFGKGVHYGIYNVLGARIIEHQGVWGVRFAVWAPEAKAVSVVADFNRWKPGVSPMHNLGSSGIWELFVPDLKDGEKYKFFITTRSGKTKYKSDPYAYRMEERPNTASIVAEVDRFAWSDEAWMTKRREGILKPHPMTVYEIHPGSWRTPYGKRLGYRDLARELATYCKAMGFTHVEFMPIQEHPLDESWGYQVTGFYAATSRYGTPTDFQWMVNYLHEQGIGVLVDWVPGHFPVDDFSLGRFDGSALYEHADPRQGFHPHWHTLIFNFGRREVSNFLIANALFWFEKMHVDGLRVDAVASMLYLDYGRKEGEWIPNAFGGKENLDAIEFFKHLNQVVHERNPGVLMIAEDSSSFPGVTKPVSDQGLGFDMKWNMGWMNDTLRYFKEDPLFRKYHQKDVTFGLLYAFTEQFMLPLSHDEVVHGKKSLISKMPGDQWQQFAHLRLLLTYQICQPGKKLLFMGAEFGQWKEWACIGELDWKLLEYPTHQAIQRMVKEMNHFYLDHPALWERDFVQEGFSWVDFSDLNNGVVAYLRKSSNEQLLCIHHFSPNFVEKYHLRVPHVKKVQEVFNSDAEKYGGSGKINAQVSIEGEWLCFRMAPLATMIFTLEF